MKKLSVITIIYVLISCQNNNIENHKDFDQTKQNNHECEGKILDLELKSFNELPNKLIKYFDSDSMEFVKDTSILKSYGFSNLDFILERSENDSTKSKRTVKIQTNIIKTVNYHWDLIGLEDNDKNGRDISYWLHSYDNKGVKVGHLDFAHWSKSEKSFHSGRIDCDSTLHMILNNMNQHRIFTITDKGENLLIEKKETEK